MSDYPAIYPCDCGRPVTVRSDRDRGKRCDVCRALHGADTPPTPKRYRYERIAAQMAPGPALFQIRQQNPGICSRCQATCEDRTTLLTAPGAVEHVCQREECLKAALSDFKEPAPEWQRCRRYASQLIGGCDKPEGHAGFCGGPVLETPPKPPTLREWLGDRVSELGRWADVLREQPVPAGLFLRFEWRGGSDFRAFTRRGSNAIVVEDVVAATRVGVAEHAATATAHDGWLESLQMALFTRHPDVTPDPRPAAIVCEDQYEVMP